MKLLFSEIARLFNSAPAEPDNTVIDTLLTDSRSLSRPASSLFFAIRSKGGNDGHNYIRHLYNKGVKHFVANEVPADMIGILDAKFIITDNVIGALQKISSTAAAAMKNKDIVAITGSRGKTTVKEWIFQLLEPLYEIARSPRSFNSQIGVPLSLWEIEPTTSLAIIEAGISQTGEMKMLADCIQPDTVIITNIGIAHSDGFCGNKEKAAEKVSLAAPASVKTIIYNLDSPYLKEEVERYAAGKRVIAWSTNNPEADLLLSATPQPHTEKIPVAYTFKGETHTLMAPCASKHELENIGASLAFLLSKGLPHDVIRERFANLRRIGTRLNVTEGVNNCSVIYDSYTSDFSSLRPAIDFMMRRAMPHQTPTLILSDLRHETAGGSEIYEAIARLVKETRIFRFIGVGPELEKHANLFPDNALLFESTEDLLQELSPSDFESEIILVKGAPEFDFSQVTELVESRKHETVLEVNLDAMVENYNYFRSHLPQGTGIVAMVKAFGYGAGSYEIAKTLQDAGAAYLAVAVLDEGIALRRKGITMPIMVMNPKVVNYKSMFAYRLEPEVYTLDMLYDVIREAEKNGMKDYPIHLKLDTGMHRTGLLPYELDEAISLILDQDNVKLATMFSHLATADCVDMDDYTLLQLSRFKEMTEYVMKRCPYYVKRHVLNSAGILRFPEHHYDMARLGIGLYGANTLPEDIEKPLAPVSSLRTVIISIREWEKEETIGYGRHGHLSRTSRIATIPIGYADGMNRHFGRGAISVKVNGKDAPTVGNICMDACMIDVTGIDCKVGDYVEIFGAEAPVGRLSDLLDTIPYEILTSVSPRVKRVYYRE